MRFNSRSNYLHGNPRTKARHAKLKRLAAKGWLDQPDQHVIDWLTHNDEGIRYTNPWAWLTNPDTEPAYGKSPGADWAGQCDAHVTDWMIERTRQLTE